MESHWGFGAKTRQTFISDLLFTDHECWQWNNFYPYLLKEPSLIRHAAVIDRCRIAAARQQNHTNAQPRRGDVRLGCIWTSITAPPPAALHENAKTVAAYRRFPRSSMWRSRTPRAGGGRQKQTVIILQTNHWSLSRMDHSAALSCSNDKARDNRLSAHLGWLKVLQLALFSSCGTSMSGGMWH